jgi:hypothetical protein
MTIRTRVKAGIWEQQHNETMASGLRVRTAVKAGGEQLQHNETMTTDCASSRRSEPRVSRLRNRMAAFRGRVETTVPGPRAAAGKRAR